jgi:outer membrane protein assembly factor BamB
MSIGGDQDYCAQGACLFALGVRVFFLLDFDKQGDGITFTLLNGDNNTANSAGGDFQLSELMGYAGDSRRVLNPSVAADWNATDPNNRGLDPPKIAVEFDTRTNAPDFNLCADANNLNPETRNDPLENNRDAVQYVFWGNEGLNIECRSDNPTYDDNRHNADDWIASTGNDVRSSPAVAADGTIYVGSDDGHLYAFDPDGNQVWRFPSFSSIGAVQSSPAIGDDGTIYVGSNDGHLYAINPGGSQKWKFPFVGSIGAVKSSPAIGTDGTIYIGSDDGNMYALDETGTLKPGWPVQTDEDVGFPRAALSLGRPGIGSDGTIYFSALNARLYARNPDGSKKWTITLGTYPLVPGLISDYMPGVDTVAGFGFVYIDVPGNAIAAFNPANGNEVWRVDKLNSDFDSDFDSTPVVGPDGTIYVGTDDDQALFAITPGASSGTVKWRFNTGDEVDNTPALSPDGSEVYVVSNDGNLYAVDAAEGEELWRFPIPVNPSDGVANSSPAVGADGTVYVGSTDNNLYAVGLPAEPRNIRDRLITSTKVGTDVFVAGREVDVNSETDWLNGDLADEKRWAVRLEVDRCPSKNLDAVGECVPDGDGKFDYELRLWMKQCINDACDNINTDDPFFKDTRIEYQLTLPPDLVQSFKLDASEFNQFFFGFTGAAGADQLDVTITDFVLSFIRPGDPVSD